MHGLRGRFRAYEDTQPGLLTDRRMRRGGREHAPQAAFHMWCVCSKPIFLILSGTELRDYSDRAGFTGPPMSPHRCPHCCIAPAGLCWLSRITQRKRPTCVVALGLPVCCPRPPLPPAGRALGNLHLSKAFASTHNAPNTRLLCW